jgi:TolA-binding protein
MAGAPDQALADLGRLTAEFPEFEHRGQARDLIAQIQYRQAWAAYKAEAWHKAADAFAQLQDHAVHGAEATYLAGVCYQRAGKPGQAEACLEHLLKEHADYQYAAEARELLGEMLTAQKKWQDAATLYASYAGDLKEPARRAEVELKHGMALYQLNQATRAREALQYAVDHGQPPVKAKALFFLGELLLMQKKYAEAKDYFLKVGVLYRHDELTPASLLEAAKCMRATGDTEQCRELLRRVADGYPKSPHAKEASDILGQLK